MAFYERPEMTAFLKRFDVHKLYVLYNSATEEIFYNGGPNPREPIKNIIEIFNMLMDESLEPMVLFACDGPSDPIDFLDPVFFGSDWVQIENDGINTIDIDNTDMSTATVTMTVTPPATPKVGDMHINMNNHETRIYNGSGWLTINGHRKKAGNL